MEKLSHFIMRKEQFEKPSLPVLENSGTK